MRSNPRGRAAIILVAAMLVLAFPASVLATHTENCQEASAGGGSAGERLDNYGIGMDGIRAKFHAYGIPETCVIVPQGADIHTWTSFFVSIENSNPSNPGILQIGMARCQQENYLESDDICEYPNQWRHFYAYGGVDGFNVYNPYPRDLGPASITTDYNYAVQKDDLGNVTFWINGTWAANVPYANVDSWWDNQDYLWVRCETADVGDSCGGFHNAPIRAYDVRPRRDSNNTWQTGLTRWVNDPCTVSGSAGGAYLCDTIWTGSDNQVDLWTEQWRRP